VFNKLARVQCIYLSNTTVFDGSGIYCIYYIRYNYMFRHLTRNIFRVYVKYLVGSCTGLLWAVYSGAVQEMSWAKDLVSVVEVGRCGYMGFLLLYVMSKLIYLGLWYHITCVVEIIYTNIKHRPNYINLDIIYNNTNPMYPHLPSSTTLTRSRAHLTSCTVPLYTGHNSAI